jgi:hypothetical protein
MVAWALQLHKNCCPDFGKMMMWVKTSSMEKHHKAGVVLMEVAVSVGD